MQHGGIFGVETIQPLRQKTNRLAFRDFDANVVEQGRHSLRRDLSMRMQHQTKPPQIGPKASSYPRRQLCCDVMVSPSGVTRHFRRYRTTSTLSTRSRTKQSL